MWKVYLRTAVLGNKRCWADSDAYLGLTGPVTMRKITTCENHAIKLWGKFLVSLRGHSPLLPPLPWIRHWYCSWLYSIITYSECSFKFLKRIMLSYNAYKFHWPELVVFKELDAATESHELTTTNTWHKWTDTISSSLTRNTTSHS